MMDIKKEILILIKKIHEREKQTCEILNSLNERVFELEKTEKPEGGKTMKHKIKCEQCDKWTTEGNITTDGTGSLRFFCSEECYNKIK